MNVVLVHHDCFAVGLNNFREFSILEGSGLASTRFALDSKELTEWQIFFPLYNERTRQEQERQKASMEDNMKFQMQGYGKGRLK